MPGNQNSSSTLDFLGTVGNNDRGDNVRLNNTAKALVALADLIITEARSNLDKGGNVATGETSSSIKAGPLQTNASRMQIDISILKTYKFLNDGVKGVEGGRGKYQFKNKYPNKKMANALMRWLRVRKIATKYKAISKTEEKNQRIKSIAKESDSQKSLAYAIATNIKKKGIKPTYFFTKAINVAKKEQRRLLSDALKIDIIETFN